jgi:carbon storage regulator CsrA
MENGHLILAREKNECVLLGDNIQVRVHRILGKRVWLSFVAPKDLPIKREELDCQQGSSGKEAA